MTFWLRPLFWTIAALMLLLAPILLANATDWIWFARFTIWVTDG